MELTIAIPTYNRNSLLLRHLTKLLPQLTGRCRLLILDNCSPTPVEETLREVLAGYPDLNCRIIRNKTNIGANANILRCLELCDTHWIWIIGDDDNPLPQAVETIFKYADENPDCLYFNFGFDGLRTETFFTRGLEEFAEKLDGSANIPWISSAVCSVPALRDNLKLGYQYAFSMLPHVAVLLMSIGKFGLCCLSKEQIIDVSQLHVLAFEPDHTQWSKLDLALGSSTLFDLPLSSKVRKQIARKLLTTNYGESMKLRVILHQLLLMAIKNKDPQTSYYLYDQIRHRSYYFEDRPNRKLILAIGWLLLRFPRITMRLYRIVKKKNFLDEKLQDRYERI